MRRDLPIDTTRVPFRYAWPVHHLLRDLKFHGNIGYARVLGTLLADHLLAQEPPSLPDFFCPVPLGRRRYLERGFNQALEVGRVVEARTRVRMCTDLVARVRETQPQVSLDARSRRRNVRHAFAVERQIDGACVAILDDVITTGSTVLEVAARLRRAGAARVDVWAVARAARQARSGAVALVRA
jgi:ComF family protein